MKLKYIHEDLIEIAKGAGINVRKDNGSFKSGYCQINNQSVIIINRSATLESSTSVLARCLKNYTESQYLKPAVRDYIEKESIGKSEQNSISLEIQ